MKGMSKEVRHPTAGGCWCMTLRGSASQRYFKVDDTANMLSESNSGRTSRKGIPRNKMLWRAECEQPFSPSALWGLASKG